MEYFDAPHHLHVHFDAKECTIPSDQMSRMQRSLAPLGEAVQDFAASELWMTCVRHPRSATFHVEAKLKVPGRTLIIGDNDVFLDTAFQRCLDKLLRQTEAYREHANREMQELAERRSALDRKLIAPEDPSVGPLGEAVRAGDYRRFRKGLAGYDEWLRARVGQWLARYPQLQAKVRDASTLDDCVEEVCLNAFERYTQRPSGVRLRDWLEDLIAPSLRSLLKDLRRERDNIRLAQSAREAVLP